MNNVEELIQCFATLGLAPGATLPQVKEAYRHSLQAFHPDKFPAESPSQKWASERLLVVKDAYEKLQKFFEEIPSGAPPGGWSTQAKTSQGPTTSPDEDGSMDWQQFDQQIHSNFAEEVKAWEERQKQKEAQQQTHSQTAQRHKMLTIGRYVVMGVLFLLLSGMYSHNDGVSRVRDEWEREFRMRWGLEIGSPMTAEAAEELHRQEFLNHEEDVLRYVQYFFLWGVTGGGCWLLFASRPKAVMQTWAETGVLNLQELKMAAKDTAQLTAGTAKHAAKVAAARAVEAAEKLKAESEKYREKRAQEKVHEAAKAKPSKTDDIIAAAEEERARMEAEFEEKRKKSSRPKPKAKTATEKTSDEKSSRAKSSGAKPAKGTKEMLDDLLKDGNNDQESSKNSAAKKRKKSTDK